MQWNRRSSKPSAKFTVGFRLGREFRLPGTPLALLLSTTSELRFPITWSFTAIGFSAMIMRCREALPQSANFVALLWPTKKAETPKRIFGAILVAPTRKDIEKPFA